MYIGLGAQLWLQKCILDSVPTSGCRNIYSSWCTTLVAEIYKGLGAHLWLKKYIRDLMPTSRLKNIQRIWCPPLAAYI